MKYKVGDRVKIRRDYKYQQGIRMVLAANNYIVTISKIEKEVVPESPYYHFEEFEENWHWADDELRYSYQSNVAMLLHDRFDLTNFEERNEAANDILKIIFDLEGNFIDWRKKQ